MRAWLAWGGTAFCWITAPVVAYAAVGSVLLLLHPFVENKLWALGWLAVGVIWCGIVWATTAAHKPRPALIHFVGCNVAALLGFAWVGVEMLST